MISGLRPYAAYKDSSVEWLGEVPEHWGLVPLKWVSNRSQTGATPPTSETLSYEDGTVPWYGPIELWHYSGGWCAGTAPE